MIAPFTVSVNPYPKCSTCSVAYVLRHGLLFDGKRWEDGWAWQRDCKHKTAEAVMVTAKRARSRKEKSNV